MTAIQSIRLALRSATRTDHDIIDRAITSGDITSVPGYARFLGVQLAAREPIERWFAACPGALAPPPAQCDLLRRDLAVMGLGSEQERRIEFAAPLSGRIGVAWALAGSSLGNRAILSMLGKRGIDGLPTAFLGDPAMPAYFASLRPTIDRPARDPASLADMIAGARAVFAHFRCAISDYDLPVAA